MDEQRSYSAWAVSITLHAALLALILLGFASAPRFEDSDEAIPIETVSISDVNQIMEGEKTAKPAPPPKPQPEPAPVPTPPEQPPQLRQAQEPPQPPAPEPPPKPEPPKPEQAKAEPPKDAPEPPQRPDPTPSPTDLALNAPEPPIRPRDPPKVKQKPDLIAKAVEQTKPEPPQQPTHAYDPNAIAKLIQPRTQASAQPDATGSATPQGLPHHDAQKMSLSMAAALDAWLTDAYLSCWTPPPAMPDGDIYVAQIKVVFNPDGSLSARPVLLNPPSDTAWRAHAESAMRAVRKCDPLHVPAQYAPFFEQWKVETIHFDPRETQG